MDSTGIRIRLATILAGIGIAVIAGLIISVVANYFFNLSYSFSFLGIILVIVLIMDIAQYLLSPYIIGRMYHLRKVNPQDPSTAWLYASLQQVCSYNNQRVPELFIAETPVANAFAYGSLLSGRRMAVTRGLLNILNRDEVEAVMGHEIGHLKHHDVALLLAIGLIPTIIFYFGYSMLFGGGRKGGNGSIFIIALVMMGVSFVFNIMILGVNRMRESYADVNSAQTIPGGAENLQTALAKIVASTPQKKHLRKSAGSSTSSMLMFSGLDQGEMKDHRRLLEEWKHMKISLSQSIFSDHPHPAKRIQMLEKLKKVQ
ncbi:zinc metalloprotease HtpX [Cuniculiplasma divulgatum]|jgi:heat shock protein HtpX|uniref:Protease HtpX homolog n=1 Tax=Cuniculiplasma divulgatum TaxID=1673428 RepID=A0A1N5SR58_9ARCH|nr:zinc metalloprotease HtpX [Cuniculiplasma divulgatum]MCI2412443.1 zinc metalloprotease HtpX [Cuniculiplasma sp.]MCL6014046.1 zinc metalloprotease HtpX [Candidatus Thermoplasmatota archaeon]WMT48522.1 MAG: zinc metalloprotease HtpX [Thermoplasmatales archaeon]SIM38421.1 subfamily M48B zinc-dependent protease with chaperone function [Cuniculiplasma divulgatum]SJK84177.1 subfamily M48B zinc-dependent protease with chaperone function [Cuniculiplasma divulgatum]